MQCSSHLTSQRNEAYVCVVVGMWGTWADHSAVKQHIDQCVRPGGKVKPRGAALRSGVCLPVLSGCERAGKGRRFPGQHLTFTNPTTSLFCYNEHKGSWGGAFSNKRQDEL